MRYTNSCIRFMNTRIENRPTNSGFALPVWFGLQPNGPCALPLSGYVYESCGAVIYPGICFEHVSALYHLYIYRTPNKRHHGRETSTIYHRHIYGEHYLVVFCSETQHRFGGYSVSITVVVFESGKARGFVGRTRGHYSALALGGGGGAASGNRLAKGVPTKSSFPCR